MNNTITETNSKIKNNYYVKQLCEISFIAGVLKQRGDINLNQFDDLEDIFDEVYNPIMEEWSNGIGKDIFLTEEEEGYISAYAQRRLTELYGVLEM